MTKFVKTASGSSLNIAILWKSAGVLVTQIGTIQKMQTTTTAENGRIKTMISREKAINLLHILPVTVFEADYDKPFRDAIFMAIEALSHERPKGRWVVENEESIRCPECCYNRARIEYPMNFCPECGCDMRGGEE